MRRDTNESLFLELLFLILCVFPFPTLVTDSAALCNPFGISDIFWLSNISSSDLILKNVWRLIDAHVALTSVNPFSSAVLTHFLIWDLSRLPGVIPSDGEVQITVTFTPVEYETSQVTMQVVVSQFNTKPYLCTITGGSAPQLALRYSTPVDVISRWRFTVSTS